MHKIRTEQKSKRSRKQKKHKAWILRIFNYKCYLSLITGCYSCQWKVKKEKTLTDTSCRCSRGDQLFCSFLIFSAALSVLLLFLWLESSNEFMGFDCKYDHKCFGELLKLFMSIIKWFQKFWQEDTVIHSPPFIVRQVIYLGTGFWFFWSILLLSILGILTVYSLLLLLLGFLLIREGYEPHLHWCHKVLILLIIVAELTLLWILLTYWRDRWLTVGLSLQVLAPFIHLSNIFVVTVFSWPMINYLMHLEGEAIQVAVGLPFFLLLLCFYTIPFGKYSPCIQEEYKLGPKPDIYGHRGAPMLGPENTMMSFEKAIEQGASGLETDIYISYDGVPFLMHDSDLSRTTNIREVLPRATFRYSANFTWSFLSTLNAGKWFLQSPPFYNMEPLSEADSEKARNQTIPKLSDFLELARKEKKVVIFDINEPPPRHPFRGTFIREIVQVILDSKIDQHLVLWLSGWDRTYVRKKAPGFQHVGRFFPVEALAKENITIINVDYKRLFYNGLRDYKAANITINLYIVNEPWLYSLAWCSSIRSVTTDKIQNLRHINRPYFFMTPRQFRLWWLLLDGISVTSIVIIFCYHWCKYSQIELFKNISTSTDTESINLQKGTSESQEECPVRHGENPWSVASLRPAISQSIRKYPGTRHFSVVPKRTSRIEPESVKENMKELMHAKDGVEPPEPIKTSPTEEVIHQNSLPIFNANEPSVSSTQVFHPKTQFTEILPTESSEESSYVFSNISSTDLPSFWSSSKKY